MHGVYFKGGDQVINTPWANAGDSRLKPIAFQGVDLSYKLTSNWTLEAGDFWQWECRTCSNFDHGTLLTTLSPVPAIGDTGVAFNGYSGAGAYPGNYYDPAFETYTNNGFTYGHIGYAGDKAFPLTANAYYYGFQNLANALWFDAKFPLAATGRYKGFIAAQGGSEANAGTALLGKISSTIFGLQAGFNPLKAVTLTGGFDTIPIKTDTVTLPGGFSCTSTHTIKNPSNYAGNLPYFLPTGGTGNCSPAANGMTNIYYGGWASPYTDSYAIDPLFTASGTQSMPDRRSPGSAFKIAASFKSDNGQFVASVGQTWYDYNNAAYAQGTSGTDFDAQYFFNKVPKKGPYKGFSLRTRLFSRSERPSREPRRSDSSSTAASKPNTTSKSYSKTTKHKGARARRGPLFRAIYGAVMASTMKALSKLRPEAGLYADRRSDSADRPDRRADPGGEGRRLRDRSPHLHMGSVGPGARASAAGDRARVHGNGRSGR